MTETSFCPEKSRIQSRLCWRYIVLLPCRKDNANTHPEWIHLVRIFIKISFLQIITFYCSLKKLWEGNAFSRVCLFSGGRFPCDHCRSVYISSLGKSPVAPPTIMADPRGCQGRVPPGDPNCLIFMEFSAKKNWKIIDYHTHFGSWLPLRKILDTPLEYNTTIKGPTRHVQNVFTSTSSYRDPRKC